LLKTVGVKGKLAPGHYRVLIQGTSAGGIKTARKGTWIWILRS
jgi:hypothetical protein